MNEAFKAITIWQPWASFVASRLKEIETRSWNTKYRGVIAIHAANRTIRESDWNPQYAKIFQSWIKTIPRIPLGSIVAFADLIDCLEISANGIGDHSTLKIPLPLESSTEFVFGDYTPGRFAWIFKNIRKLKRPLRVMGSQRLWNWHPTEFQMTQMETE